MSVAPRFPDKAAAAIELRAARLTLPQIAERLDLHIDTVRGYVGATPRGGTLWSDEKVEQLKLAWLSGDSGASVARQLGAGFTRCSVIAKVHRLGLERSAAIGESNRSRAQVHRHAKNRAARPRLVEARPATDGLATWKPVGESLGPMPVELAASTVGANAKPFGEQERGECAWPIDMPDGSMLACCEPIVGKGWCVEHFRRGTVKAKPSIEKSGGVATAARRFA